MLNPMAVLAYIIKDGMVLLIKRGTPPYLGFWSLPGGGTGKGEDPREACIREVKEETGLIVALKTEEIYRIRSTPIYSCRILAGKAEPHLPETVAASWFSLEEAVQLQLPPFIKEFLKVQRKKI